MVAADCGQPMERPMQRPNDLSRSRVNFEQEATLIVVIEMGQASWLVASIVLEIERPLGPVSHGNNFSIEVGQRTAASAAE